jgi:ankyrin repeat protein
LIKSVRSREDQSVRKLIAASPDLVNAHDASGATLLHHAAGFGNLETMKLLLDKGADVNAGNRRKSTPLFWALHDEAKTRLLLSRGADVNARSVDGRTPLYQAASLPNAVAVLRLLLEKGANPNARTLNGMTPLIAAARTNIDSLRFLLDAKVDVNARNAAGGTALMAAAATGNPLSVRLLLDKGADPNLRTKRNESALADAATAGNEQTVKLLLDHGAEVDTRDIRGYSPLLYAAGSDAMPAGVVKMLLDKGADTNARGDDETAAMLAAKRGDTEVARLLGVFATPASVVDRSSANRPISAAVGPALDLLAKQSHNFIRIGGCNSCHAQDLPSAAAGIAHDHGLPAPKEIPQLPQSMHTLSPSRIMDLTVVSVAGQGWEMFDFGNNGVPRDEYTDASVRYIKEMQSPAGNWEAPESRRPPMNAGIYQATAMAIYSLKTYGPPVEKADTGQALARAAAWLENARPAANQDRAFQVLGLVWANARPAAIASAAKTLASSQRTDGGWSQFSTLESDAYASGQALFALNAAGMSPSDPVYAKGVKFLLNSQAADGSWHVKTRSIWLQPYFDSGFPYGPDQWISAAGTAWATMALSVTNNLQQRTSAGEGQIALAK